MHIESPIHIDAPHDVVWSVATDVERWPEWAPTFESVSRVDRGAFRHGSAAVIRQPGLPAAHWTVTDLEPGQRFTWETRVLGLHMLATHVLFHDGTGTRNVLQLELRGAVARVLWLFIRSSLRSALETENAGLRARCEALHRDAPVQ